MFKKWARRILVLLLAALAGVGVFITQVSKPGAAVEGAFDQSNDRDDRRESPGIRIFSINLCHDFPRHELIEERLTLVGMFIRQHNPDIICLQEASWNRITKNAAAFLAEHTGFNHAYYRANGNHSLIGFEEGQAILSRYPILETKTAVLKPQAGFFENRTALYARIDTPVGPLGVVSTHLSGDESVQAGQTKSLMAFVAASAGDAPVVIAGDFNFTQDAEVYKSVVSEWMDVFYFMHPEKDGNTCCVGAFNAADGATLSRRIDYVFTWNKNAARKLTPTMSYVTFDRPVSAGSQSLWASDHAGIFAEFRF